MSVLITGGARSGKSAFAERWCMKHAPSAVYIATAQVYDEEMRERVALHRRQRSEADYAWTTLEEPLRLTELLKELVDSHQAAPMVLVDCLTLWLSNVLLGAGEGSDSTEVVEREIERLVEAVKTYSGQLVLVTNEVGSGIVPEYPLGRQYRDLAGRLNRKMAEISGQVFLVTAGIPVELKSRAYEL
ncbi:bifunctional adenosylcobinamide kinase/adenosylcobinamide-phosphate guanylyltransferase [Paenibacillus zeisoli]|uniref:Adenosylcobinamide kinase n=1 Tax=Paenibacillus zeisoli TaxID=2496267 RepID=A0A433X2X8_9BACL|nr:bifunctional adenosylcobinamide kinase/adenosylcobinamide-phosphate guanylyltransferase [Paenibacillus zeisoli]RUT28416.1 bifunctional adenosylcobinamide kinase/adenosylcobinamide-phosphate guanylyltransferase [Paenibacillus zeisoli]